MPNSLPEALVLAAVSFIAGFTIGQLVEFRKDKTDGRRVHVKVNRHPFDHYMRLLLIVLFLAGVGFLVATSPWTSQ